jgi:hypothetical protein
MDEEAVAMISRDGFAELLERPVGRGMGRHMAVEYAARGVLHHHKDVEKAKGRRDHHTEITRHDRLGMLAHKDAPALCRRAFPSSRVQARGQILAYSAGVTRVSRA